MQIRIFRVLGALTSVLICTLAAQAQEGANEFDPRDFTGI